MSVRLPMLFASMAVLLAGCARDHGSSYFDETRMTAEDSGSIKDGDGNRTATHTEERYEVAEGQMTGPPINVRGDVVDAPIQAEQVAWNEPAQLPSDAIGPHAVAESDGPYLLDTADRLRIFVYGQPSLSRQYTVDHAGRISVPLIGEITARGKTTTELQRTIRARLGSEFVKDPQVTVDIQQNRPFFIYGEVRNAGQFPYVSGMTVETAIAIAGGFTDRASERKYRITRRVNGFAEQVEAPGDYVVKPGDTVYVFERFF